MNELQELKQRYAYMFAGNIIELSVAKGWMPLIAKLCEDIDAVLGADKQGFSWQQVKEKFGTARFYFRLGKSRIPLRLDVMAPDGVMSMRLAPPATDGGPDLELVNRISALTDAAEGKTRQVCLVCGEPGTLDRTGGHLLNLCEAHAKQRREGAGQMESPWLE
jgi:hypothetical protein